MRINAHTKIAALLKGHPDALDTIVALRPDFKKLRNPVLRKLMAGRTSIAAAARIGGCTTEDFFKALAPLGFEAERLAVDEDDNAARRQPVPGFLQRSEEMKPVTLDVRPVLAEGTDPLRLIQQTIKGLQAGEVLHIVNTFEPTPLIKLLEKQGFEAYVDRSEDGVVETYFYKTGDALAGSHEADANNDDLDSALKIFEERLQEIDVRQLEMPGPMMAILGALEKLPGGDALLVHHKRVPVYLLSELKDRGFEYRIKEESEGQVKLVVFRAAS